METEDKYKLLIIRTKYLKNTLLISEEIFQKAYADFMVAVNEKVTETMRPSLKEKAKNKEKENIVATNQETKKETEEKIKEKAEERIEAEKEEKDENLKQVFKKIAKEIHPDKLEKLAEFEKKYKESLFEKARIALDNNDYYAIVEVAEELGIDPPLPTKNQIEMMKNTNNKLEKKIKNIEKSLIWDWYHAEEDRRKKLLELYIDHLKKNNIRP